MLNKSSIYYRFGLVALLCFFITSEALAQQLFTVTGVLFKKNSPVTIAQATVTNVNRKLMVTSDELGGFHIIAAMGDTLVFRKSEYATQNIVVQTQLSLSIYMDPVIQLNEVVIKDMSKRQELDKVMDDYKKKGQYSTLNPSVGSVLSSPLSGLYALFGKGPAQARRFKEYSQQEMEHIAISKRYNKKLVQQITNMPDEEASDFMIAFTPSYEDIMAWSDYDIINYIKKSFSYFKDHKGMLKAEKLY